MSLRDPSSSREMPPNTNTFISANTVRGVRRVTPADYKSYALQCKPDIVFALGDIAYPSTNASGPQVKALQPLGGMSQKRNIKSVERTLTWLGGMLSLPPNAPTLPMATFVSLVGGASILARGAFANGLVETLYGPEADLVKPLKTLDEGVRGYVLELVPMVLGLGGTGKQQSSSVKVEESTSTAMTTTTMTTQIKTEETENTNETTTTALIPLIQASLSPLPSTKPRIVFGGSSAPDAKGSSVGPRRVTTTTSTTAASTSNTASITTIASSVSVASTTPNFSDNTGFGLGPLTPITALLLTLHCGIDLFDSKYAEEAASVGVALGFRFPAPSLSDPEEEEFHLPLGYNLYDTRYRMDFSSVGAPSPSSSDSRSVGCGWKGAAEQSQESQQNSQEGDYHENEICLCPTCSPLPPDQDRLSEKGGGIISHSVVDRESSGFSTALASDSKALRQPPYRPPYTRAYVHHLLHTHEMSAHTLLVMHNLEVWRRFWEDVRRVLSGVEDGGEGRNSKNSAGEKGKVTEENLKKFREEVGRFRRVYGGGGSEGVKVGQEMTDLVEEAREMWKQVDVLRGKGRLAREREKETKASREVSAGVAMEE
ncbi:hypothetical protein K435DRAFT_785436 [Dendrothele bispora CBS 962.96]|uniref:tRNA-guanine(15) transglycosylase-like domain-containing protein n=1 Tax=Dendrothele bispora (strain CBS 962.96) TaxID=1314807 RepID=A0A4S8KWZ0_DENBC|nr:hypothetical protein K435DRAFT_785436 [Dendrothele bispora CBS 962.96]